MKALATVAALSCSSTPPPSPATIASPDETRAATPPNARGTPSPTGDAEGLLRGLLLRSAPFRLFFQVYRDGQLSCEEQRFSNVTEGGTKFELDVERPPPSVLRGGWLSSLAMPTLARGVHGYSSRSVLVGGSEGFFLREDCLERGLRYPPRAAAAPPTVLDFGDLLDEHGSASVWYLGQRQASWTGRRDAWLQLDRETYEARFYGDASVVWLRGPLGVAAPARAGLYEARASSDSFSIGGDVFCRASGACPSTLARAVEPLVRAAPRDEVVDFAEQFWRHREPLFAPIRDSGGVSCVELRPEHGKPLVFDAFGQRREHPIVRSPVGFRFWRRTPGGFVWGQLVVHGRDEQAFWLDGSPWYFRRADCLRQRERVKPVNMRAPGMVTLTDAFGEQKVPLQTRYFVVDDSGASATCRRLQLRPLRSGGRLELETEHGVEARDYDFYVDDWAFWIGPTLTDQLSDAERRTGTMMVPRPTPSGVELAGWHWYAREPDCLAELARRRGAAGSATSSSAPASADR